jgi:hypothetical protein
MARNLGNIRFLTLNFEPETLNEKRLQVNWHVPIYEFLAIR